MRELEAVFLDYRDGGNPDAFAELWDRCAPPLHRLARRIATDPGDAEEALQRTFLAVLEGSDRFERGRALMPWLFSILRHQLAQVARERHRAMRCVAREGRSPLDPSELAAKREFEDELAQAIEKLPEQLRVVLRLRLWHGLAPRSIAETLERSPSTVRTQLARGLAQLRALLPKSLAGIALLGREAKPMAMLRSSVLGAAWSSASPALCAGVAIKSFAIVLGAVAVLVLAALQGVEGGVAPGLESPLSELAHGASEAPASNSGADTREPSRLSSRVVADAPGRSKGAAVFRLRVVDGGGRAVPGIRVDLRAGSAWQDELDAFLFGQDVETRGSGRARLAKTGEVQRGPFSRTSDADGCVEARLAAGAWVACVNRMRASHADYGETRVAVEIRGEDTKRQAVLQHARARLHVRVVDERGRPAPDVALSLVRESEVLSDAEKPLSVCKPALSGTVVSCVACHRAPKDAAPAAPEKSLRIARAQSDRSGVAVFRGLRAGRYRVLLGQNVDALVFCSTSLDGVAVAQSTDEFWRPARAAHMVDVDGWMLNRTELRVARKGRLRIGLGLRDRGGSLAVKARAATLEERRALARGSAFEAASFESAEARELRNANFDAEDPECVVERLAPGVYELGCSLPSSSGFVLRKSVRVLVEAGRETSARVLFERASASVRGRVLVAGLAAPACALELVDGAGNVVKRGQSGPDGEFVFLGVRRGAYRVRWTRVERREGRRGRELRGSFGVDAPCVGLEYALEPR